jgi:hypothetical protein
MIARQTTATSGAASEPEAPQSTETITTTATDATEPAGEVDLEQLAEQVSRLIFRRLAVERERRGIGRWH